jgi:hypothetical protein
MKCRPKDCKDCVHFVNIRTHPLWRDFVIKDESGKNLVFEGCIEHLKALFLRQQWVGLVGLQSAVESNRNAVTESVLILAKGIMATHNLTELDMKPAAPQIEGAPDEKG